MRRSVIVACVLAVGLLTGCGDQGSPLAPSRTVPAPQAKAATAHAIVQPEAILKCAVRRNDSTFGNILKGFLFGWVCPA